MILWAEFESDPHNEKDWLIYEKANEEFESLYFCDMAETLVKNV